jgi:hypothetical protein
MDGGALEKIGMRRVEKAPKRPKSLRKKWTSRGHQKLKKTQIRKQNKK